MATKEDGNASRRNVTDYMYNPVGNPRGIPSCNSPGNASNLASYSHVLIEMTIIESGIIM